MNKKFYKASDGEIVGFLLDAQDKPICVTFFGRSESILTKQMDEFLAVEQPRAQARSQVPAENIGRGAGTRWMTKGTMRERTPPDKVKKRLSQGWIFKGPKG